MSTKDGPSFDVRGKDIDTIFATNFTSDRCMTALVHAQQKFHPDFPGWALYRRVLIGDDLLDRTIEAFAIGMARGVARARVGHLLVVARRCVGEHEAAQVRVRRGEVDRADEPFEAFLLEYLGEYQVSIPEIGTVRAAHAPVTILTSNRTRELNDAVKRRCLYHWLDYPQRERELAIVQARVPQASAELARQVAQFVGRLRSQPFADAFQRAPGIAESVEWAKALVALDTLVVDPEVVADTAGILFKQREDVAALMVRLIDDTSAIGKVFTVA